MKVKRYHFVQCAEKHICNLSEDIRKVLLHFTTWWHSSSSIHLWPYAVHYCNNVINHLPVTSTSDTPLELFSHLKISTKLSTFHTFGCPVYDLHTKFQNNLSISRWYSRCQVGLYLDSSSRHAQSISLVLNLETARTSPQFHVQHKNFFETVSNNKDTSAQWKQLAYFSKQ